MIGTPPPTGSEASTAATTQSDFRSPRIARSPDGRFVVTTAQIPSLTDRFQLVVADPEHKQARIISGIHGCSVAFSRDNRLPITGGPRGAVDLERRNEATRRQRGLMRRVRAGIWNPRRVSGCRRSRQVAPRHSKLQSAASTGVYSSIPPWIHDRYTEGCKVTLVAGRNAISMYQRRGGDQSIEYRQGSALSVESRLALGPDVRNALVDREHAIEKARWQCLVDP